MNCGFGGCGGSPHNHKNCSHLSSPSSGRLNGNGNGCGQVVKSYGPQTEQCCPPPCCPPIVIKTPAQNARGQCCVFQLPPVNIICEIPPQKTTRQPKVCCVPIMICEEEPEEEVNNNCSQQDCFKVPIEYCPQQRSNGNGNGNGYGQRRC